ncbi:hypothetical protein GALMADRAFT_253669 [Galerina marginata CBS 339.88]|uniref:F-box domain-containing protein n=1 Tax=Galerina marginata (strain CBS 339.88) TaxID=685588 RepID=A0A067SYP4_GALM3|nr:hypothetical protein GALMADRAFT_253669 [Galerina marginata CBS 339.88]
MASSCLTQNSAVNQVPYDVWRTIFGIYVSDSAESSIEFDPNDGPLLLGQICSAWRRITVESPELWCNIEVAVDEDCRAFPKKELLEVALERARRSLLRLGLRVRDEEKAPSASKIHLETADMVDILLSNVSRAVHLEVDVRIIHSIFLDHPHGPQRFHKFIGQGAPSLVHLEISGKPFTFSPYSFGLRPGPYINPIIAKLWTPAPKLQTLNLCGHIHFQPENSSIMEPLGSSLNHLRVLNMASPISAKDFIAILSVTKQLAQCTVEQLTGELPVYSIAHHPIQLQFLSDLDMGGSGEVDDDYDETSPPLTQVVMYLRAPTLTSLHLRHDRGWSHSSFSAFLHHSSCIIRHLTLDIQDSSEIEKLECLELLPLLKTLNTCSGDRRSRESDSHFLTGIFANALKKQDFSRRGTPFRICPILEHIELDYEALYDHASVETVFANMVKRRLLSSTHFRSVRVRKVRDKRSDNGDYGYVSFEILSLLSLRRSGLELKLNPKPSWAVLLE